MQEVAIISYADNDSTIFVDLKTQAHMYRQRHNACIGSNGCAFSRQHSIFFAAQRNKDAIHLYWPLKDAPRLHHTSERVECLTISHDGVYLAAGTKQGHAYIWHLNSGNMLRILSAHYRAVNQILFTPDTSFLVTASADSTVKSWNLAEILDVTQQNTTPPCHRVITDHHLSVTDLKGCARPGWVISASLDMTIKVMDILDGTVLFTRPLPCAIHCLASNKLTNAVFAGGADGTVYGVPLYVELGGGWSAAATPTFMPQTLQTSDGFSRFEGHSGRIVGLCVTTDDKCLVSASEDGHVNLWDIASCQLMRTVFTSKAPITGLILALLPKVLPTEKSIAQQHPLGATLRKYPLTDFSSYAITLPTARLKARLELLEKDKVTIKDIKAKPLFKDSMQVDEEEDAAEETAIAKLEAEMAKLRGENARLLALNNKLFSSFIQQ